MTHEALKSAVITDFDASPIVRHTTGNGAPGVLQTVHGSLAPTSGDASTSTYRIVRFPSNAIVKHVFIWWDAAVTTFAADIDAAWSDSVFDTPDASKRGTTAAGVLTGGIPQLNSADNTIFGAAVNIAGAVLGGGQASTGYNGPYDGMSKLPSVFGYVAATYWDMPIWQQLGLTGDPGGAFDVLIKLTSATSSCSGGILHCEVQYVLQG